MSDAGRYADAEQVLAEYLRGAKDDVAARMMHADLLNKLARYHYAVDEVKLVLAARPDDGDAHLLMAKILQNMHRTADSVAEYKKFLEGGNPSDVQKQQFKTLIMVLEDEAKAQAARKDTRKQKTGDFFNALVARGATMRWKTPAAIKVFVADGKNVEGYRGEFEESLRQAFDEWNEASDGVVGFVFVDNAADAQMKVLWTSDLHAPALKAEAGHAQSHYGPNGIESSDISLLTVDPFKDGPIGRNHLYNICLHEIGHALGLQAHSPHEEDIMYPSLYTQQGLSHRDINTLLALYSNKVEQASELPFVDEWGRPLTAAAKAERLAHEGNTAAVAGQFRKAIEKLETSLEMNPNNDVARRNLAVCANNLAIADGTTTESAISLLRKALKWDPKSELCKQNLEIFVSRVKQK